MKKIAIFLLLCLNLHAQDGIVIPVCDRYMETFYPSLAWLRIKLKSTLPIEVWHSGDELSDESKELINSFGHIEFRDIAKVRGGDPKEFRGYQIKPLVLQASSFDRVILIDADVFMFVDPKVLFELSGFIETGAFFFRDTDIRLYRGAEASAKYGDFHAEYFARKSFYKTYLDEPSQYMPDDWRFYWAGDEPTEDHPKLAELMESGVVVMDKLRHQQGIEEIVQFNLNWKETYNFILGDKDTFWLGLERASEPYAVNSQLPYMLFSRSKMLGKRPKKIDLVHYINDRVVFQQKAPIPVSARSYYCPGSDTEKKYPIPKEDIKLLSDLYSFSLKFAYKPNSS